MRRFRNMRFWGLVGIGTGFLLIGLVGCGFRQSLPMVATDGTGCRRIETGPGPEDFVLDNWNGAPRFLISCHERRKPSNGSIRFYHPDTGNSGILPRSGEPDRLKTFKPHGIDIVRIGGETLLYVILHDPYETGERLENAVGVYRVGESGLQMVALMEDSDRLWSPNDLSVLETGEIYLTNDVRGNMDMYLRRRVSEIAYYNPVSGKWAMAADGLAYANGILAEKDRVFVTTTLGNRVLAFPRNPDGTLGEGRTLVELKGADNLTRYGRFLLTTAHYDDFAFLRHAKDAMQPSPSIVMRIDPDREIRKAIYVNPGKSISAASTALIHNGKLYISQVFDPFLLVCDVPSDIDW